MLPQGHNAVAGLPGGTVDRPPNPLGMSQARPPSSIFEMLQAKAGSGGKPVGEKALSKEQQELLERQKQIAEALEKGDAGKLRDLAKDQKAMVAATPDQKTAMLTSLRCDITNSKSKGDRGDREAIIHLLEAAGSDDPARQLLQSAQSLAQKLGNGQALDALNRLAGALDQLRTVTVPGFDQQLVQRANQLLAQAPTLGG